MKFPFWPDFKGYRNIELGLSRVIELLARLDNPHLKIPPTIHIAGTNGKGSTQAFLRSIFTEEGYAVHSYTSPHLVNFNERIIIAGQEISDDFLNQCLLECKNAAEKSPKIDVTFFEGITVAAFLAFSKIKADILLLEVGMGGRLDATNVLPKVLCSIITPIAFDHTDFLGNSLAKIAFEKAGIIKKSCPVIISKQKPSALKTLENQALAIDSTAKVFQKDWSFSKSKTSANWEYKSSNHKFILPKPALAGDHQFENAALAITAALDQKQFFITENHIKSAIAKTFWPARLQKINSGKFFKILPNNFELYLDGSHNLQGSATIKKFLKNEKDKKIFVIFSMLKDKNCAGFLKKLAKEIDHLIAVPIADEPKARSPEEIKIIAKKNGIFCKSSKNFNEAFANILSSHKSSEPALILVCGSLYLAGNFLEENGNQSF